jgi:hypothetical protein
MKTESGGNPVRSAAAYLVAILMLLLALSLWTVIPVAWLWIGSQLAATQFPAMGPYAVVLVGVIVSILLVSWVLGHLNELYQDLTGVRTVEAIRLGWLKSLRDSESSHPPTLLETVIVGSVAIACVTLVIWFFTIAGSPLAG